MHLQRSSFSNSLLLEALGFVKCLLSLPDRQVRLFVSSSGSGGGSVEGSGLGATF